MLNEKKICCAVLRRAAPTSAQRAQLRRLVAGALDRTAADAAQAWWRTMFLGAGEDDSLRAPPAGFFKWK